MKPFLVYWLWPNPAGWSYATVHVRVLLGICVVLILLSLLTRSWRRSYAGPVTKTLSTHWATVLLWYGIIGIVFAVARVETIQFLSMRVLWAVWGVTFLLYALFQMLLFRRRHYSIVKSERMVDERERYLPRRKR